MAIGPPCLPKHDVLPWPKCRLDMAITEGGAAGARWNAASGTTFPSGPTSSTAVNAISTRSLDVSRSSRGGTDTGTSGWL